MTIASTAATLADLRYPTPINTVCGLSSAILLGRSRSFRRDALSAVARLRPPLCITGSENIPSSGPGLCTINHYYRPGFKAWWLALALSAAIPVDVHWVMTSALTFPGRRFGIIRSRVSRWLLRRMALVYGFSPMPAMPPAPDEVRERAQAVRQILAYVRDDPLLLIGLAPEGHDNLRGGLMVPPSGVGRFILHLARLGLAIFPVAGYECPEGFHLCFGKAYQFELPKSLPHCQVDKYVSEFVMYRIADLLPEDQRGDYL